jgi:acetoin utilization deacetylase AcuC-like enzyme/GNAT superfamily N-acetyltransferase
MFRIRRIFDDILSGDREAIRQVQEILRVQFSAMPERDIRKLPNMLKNPLKYRFRSILFVADDQRMRVKGFALLNHAPDADFCYLDYLSTEAFKMGKGVGGALYQRVRDEAVSLGAFGLFFECLPDDPKLCDPKLIRQNRARLRFYEEFGAYPIIGTTYETPLRPGAPCPPYLVFDPLGRTEPLSLDKARGIVSAILERKYGAAAPPGYIAKVIESFREDPVRTRPPVYPSREASPRFRAPTEKDKRIALIVSDIHALHHVHERGYVESPVRVRSLLKGIEETRLFENVPIRRFPEKIIKQVHAPEYVDYLKRVCTNAEPGRSVYPYVFPVRNPAKPPKELSVRAGYYCIDTFTPLNREAFTAAKRAVDCALTAADAVLRDYRLSYALVRPPGHHAERRVFGGFCYFNSAAIAAHYLNPHGRVAILDIDYHHGNGTQDIFYRRSDVLTLSIHGHPSIAYPYFSGFPDERGEGEGLGFNVNYPLPENVGAEEYRIALRKAVHRIIRFKPDFLILSLGFDTAKGDPTGSWNLEPKDFQLNGRIIGAVQIPTIVIQEGGYRIRSLARNAGRFFVGLWQGALA